MSHASFRDAKGGAEDTRTRWVCPCSMWFGVNVVRPLVDEYLQKSRNQRKGNGIAGNRSDKRGVAKHGGPSRERS